MEKTECSVPTVSIRPDGRAPLDYRPTRFRWNVVGKADGSCYYEQGNAKVLCSVFGPSQRFRMRKLDDAAILRCHMYTSRMSGQDRRKMKARADKETHSVLEQALSSVILLDQYPRTRIDTDGNNVAVCLNAANFALMDAGIYMRGLLTVLACSYANDNVVIDVSEQDQETNGVVLVGSITNSRLDDLFADATLNSLKGIFIEDNVQDTNCKTAITTHDNDTIRAFEKLTYYDEAFDESNLSDSDVEDPIETNS